MMLGTSSEETRTRPFLAGSVLALGLLLNAGLAEAQVGTAITSSGLGTAVTALAPGFLLITGGTRPTGPGGGPGPNLFHSFGRFSIGSGDLALFGNLTPSIRTERIVGRVTGGERSSIYGTINTLDYPGAALYLLNPAGFLFGPGATLDVAGSFHAVAADYVRFVDGARFYADPARPTVLTVAPPAAFGFLGPTAGTISVVEGTILAVPEGQTLSLVGGDTTITGSRLRAPSGRIQIASVASGGEVTLGTADAPDLGVGSFERMGRVEVSQGARVDAIGDGGGTVAIRGGRLLVHDGAFIRAGTLGDTDGAALGIDLQLTQDLVADNSSIISFSLGAGRAGDVRIRADSTQLTNAFLGSLARASGRGGNVDIATGSLSLDGSTVSTGTEAGGRSGDIALDVGRLTLTGGSEIVSRTSGQGTGGAITITASDSIALSSTGGRSVVQTVTDAAGDAGHITITAPTVEVRGGTVQTTSFGDGRAGDLGLSVGTLTVTDGGRIDTSSQAAGPGGTLTVTANDAVSVSGKGVTPSRLSSIAVASGNAGRILVSAPAVTLTDGGLIFAATGGDGRAGDITVTSGRLELRTGGQINSDSADAAGAGGTVTVTARDSISVSGKDSDGTASRVSSSASGDGPAGRVLLSAPAILLDDGGNISAFSRGQGNAGDIVLRAGRLSIDRGAFIDSSTDAGGRGGTLTISASEGVSISGRGGASAIRNASTGRGDAGLISISTPSLTMDGAGVGSSSTGDGRAGDIRIDAARVALTGGAAIDSSTGGAGEGGTVTVVAGDSLSVSGRNAAGIGSRISSFTGGTGDAGQVIVSAPTLLLADGGNISAFSVGQGSAGSIVVGAGRLTLSGEGFIDSSTHAGHGGTITISTSDSVSISGRQGTTTGIRNATTGRGDAGLTSISTPGLTMDGGLIASSSTGDGRAGDIRIDAARVALGGGAVIDSSTAAAGAGGSVTVNAAESITLAGADSRLSSDTAGAGAAGRITVVAPSVSLADRGRISVTTSGTGNAGGIEVNATRVTLSGGARIDSGTGSDGQGGTARVAATDAIEISGRAVDGAQSGISSNTAGRRAGGDIDLSAALIRLTDGAQVTARSTGEGDAGNIRITARNSLVRDSAVATDSTGGTGGNINILVRDVLQLTRSEITATVKGGEGRGGNIAIGSPATIFEGALLTPIGGPGPQGPSPATLSPTEFVILQGSQIRADAFGGPGGNVQVAAKVFLQSDSVVSASSALGLPGTVDINAQITNLSSSLARLPESVLQAAALLRESCAARFAGGGPSTLALGGRDGLPPAPGGALASPPLVSELAAAELSGPEWRSAAAPRSGPALVEVRCSK